METFGKIDILVNNAGAFFKGSKMADNLDFDAVQKVMEANLTSAALCSYRAGLKMLDQGYGADNQHSLSAGGSRWCARGLLLCLLHLEAAGWSV